MKRASTQEVSEADPTLATQPPLMKQVVTTTTTGPALPLSPPPIPGRKQEKDHVNVWFSKLEPAYRLNHCAFYLYRLDPNIVVVNPDLEGRANGSMLDRLEADVIGSFTDNFLADLQVWTKQKYGGGNFVIQINDKKQHRLMYDIGFKVEGAPILSNREGYTSGAIPSGQALDGTNVGMILKYIDEKVSGVKAGSQDPAAAMSQVASVIMESNNRAFQWVLQNQPKAAEPMQQLEQMKMMFELFKTLQPGPAPAAAPAPSVMEQIQTFAAVMKAVREMEPPRPTENQPSIAAQIAEGIAKAGITRGKGGTDWSWLAEVGKSLAPAAAPLVLALVEKIRSSPAPGQPAAQGNVLRFPGNRPGAPVPPATGTRATSGPVSGAAQPGMPSAPPAAGPAGPPAPAPPYTPPPAVVEPQEITTEVIDAVSWYKAANALVKMLQNDREGSDAAASIDDIFPEVALLFRFATPEMIQVKIEGDPVLSQIKGDPRLPEFLRSFRSYFIADPEGGEGDAPKVQ